MARAAIVIIGNEILSGKFDDENTPYLVRQFRDLGLDLCRVAVIPDEVAVIADEVQRASRSADHVFTTGGVGPTHDDVTMAAIAAAFNVPLYRHPTLAGLIHAHYGDATNEPALRMADIPEGAELWWDGDVRFPLVVKANVAIFPGVPSLLRLKFDAVAHRYRGTRIALRRLCTLAQETTIADCLTEAATLWPSVNIGSYPRFERTPHRVLVTLESRDAEALHACEAYLRDRIVVVEDEGVGRPSDEPPSS